jgi:FKBP-type peptidyl-prolyl cis-trans isomerase
MKYLGVVFLGILLFAVACKQDEVEPPSAFEQFFIDSELIDIWLTENEVTDTLIEENSHIRYTINEMSPVTGISPRFNEGDTVWVDYEGRLLETGEVFDSAINADLALDLTIPGWQIMLPQMSEGDVFTIYLQSIYGYGADGRGSSIPPDANLVFDIKLNKVTN